MARPEVIVVTHNPDTLRAPFARTLERPDWLDGSYNHGDRDMGGFWNCEFKLQLPEDELDYWFENGLDWAVKPIGESGKTLFEGYIDEFEYQKRGVIKRRRLGRMANRVWIRYSDGTSSGLRSTVFNDTLLQEQYGIKERPFSGSKMLGLGQADQAAQVLFNRVRSAANPSVTSLAKPTDQVALTVRCNGWFHKLFWRVYNNASATGQIAAYALIGAMLDSLGSQAVINYCLNPSFEVNVTDDWVLGGAAGYGSVARDGTYSKVGSYSCKMTAGSGNTKLEQAATTGGLAVPDGATVSISGWIRSGADPTGGKARFSASVVGSAVYIDLQATSASNGAWEYLSGSWTNTTGSTKQIAFGCRNLFNDSATNVWFDACQLELGGPASLYTDGTLPNCGWSGTPHNSTSWRKTMPLIDHREIERNDTAVQQKYDGDMTIGDLAINIASLGDAIYQVWLVGMRERRTFYYEPWATGRLA